MSKVVSGTAEGYVWDMVEGLPTILQDGSTRYVTGPDGLPIEQIDGSGTVLYYYADQLGSTRGLLNASGQVVASYWYDAYGTRHVVTGTASTTPFGYAGQYTDAETGLQYLRARYYDPATQQFLSPDPLAAITGLPYAYTPADPLNGTDASGLTTGQICVSIQGGFGLGGFIQICPLAQSTDPTGTHSDEYGFTISVGGGKYTPSASVGGGITVTNADTLEQLNGGGVYAGGSVGEGWGIGGDVSYNLNTCHPVVGVGVSVSLGVRDAVPPIPIPAEIHAGYSNTWAIQYKDVPGLILSTIVRLL